MMTHEIGIVVSGPPTWAAACRLAIDRGDDGFVEKYAHLAAAEDLNWNRPPLRQVSADEFCGVLPLDYPTTLAGEYEYGSQVITKLVNWCSDLGYILRRKDAVEVLRRLVRSRQGEPDDAR